MCCRVLASCLGSVVATEAAAHNPIVTKCGASERGIGLVAIIARIGRRRMGRSRIFTENWPCRYGPGSVVAADACSRGLIVVKFCSTCKRPN